MRIPASTLFVCMLAWMASGAAQAQDDRPPQGELALTDDSVQLTYMTDAESVGVPDGDLSFGFFFNEERDIVGSAAVLIDATQLRWNRFSISFGPKMYAALLGETDTDVFSLAVGGEARYELLRRNDVDLVVRGFYAPDILTFGSADRVYDVSAHVEIPLTERTVGFAGYRYYKTDLIDDSRLLENSVYLGARRGF